MTSTPRPVTPTRQAHSTMLLGLVFLVATSAGCESEATAKRRAEEAQRKAHAKQKAAEQEVLFKKKLPLDPAPDFGVLSNSVQFHPIRSLPEAGDRIPDRPDQFGLFSIAGAEQPHALAIRNREVLGLVCLVDGKMKQLLAKPMPYLYQTLSHDMKHMSYVSTRSVCVIATLEDGVVTPIISHRMRRSNESRAIFNDKCVTVVDGELYTTYSLHTRKVIAQTEEKSWPTPGGRFLLHKIDDGIGFFDCRSGEYKGAIPSRAFQFAHSSADGRWVAILEGFPRNPQELVLFDVEKSQRIASIALPSPRRDYFLESGWWTNRYYRVGHLLVDVDQQRIIAQIKDRLPISRRGSHGPVWLFRDRAVMIPITDAFLNRFSSLEPIQETILFDNRYPVEVTVEYEVEPPSESRRKRFRNALDERLERAKFKQGPGGAQLRMVIKEDRKNGTFKLFEKDSFPPRSYVFQDDELSAEFTLTFQGREMASFRRAVDKSSQVGSDGARIREFKTFDAELAGKRWPALEDQIRHSDIPRRVTSDGAYHEIDLSLLETGEIVSCELMSDPPE